MPRHTRRNPSGPLLSADQLAKVEKAKRGAPANKRWAQVLHDMGPITADNFDRQFAYYKHLTHRRRGGRTRRHTRRR